MGRESKTERCAEWEGRAKQIDVLSGKGEQNRDAEVRRVGKETDKQVQHFAHCVKPLASISRKGILRFRKHFSVAIPKGKSPEGD